MFLPKDKVYIIPLDCYGVVISCSLSTYGNEYYVRYYIDKEQKQIYFFEEELKRGNS